MTRDLGVSDFKATAGISTFTTGYSVVPLLISSVSEDFGRHPIYIVTAIGFCLMHVVVALCVLWPRRDHVSVFDLCYFLLERSLFRQSG